MSGDPAPNGPANTPHGPDDTGDEPDTPADTDSTDSDGVNETERRYGVDENPS